jgi:diguanylate cyclase (GGDEF)-like protein
MQSRQLPIEKPRTSLRYRLLTAFFVLSVPIIAITATAVAVLLHTARDAALLEAEDVAETIAADNAADFFTGRDRLRRYAADVHKKSGRDFFVVDLGGKIIADTNPDEVGTAFAGDPDNAIGQTIADGRPRAFVESDTSGEAGAQQLAVPFRTKQSDPASPIIGAVILEFTQMHEELVTLARHDMVAAGMFGLACVLFAAVFGWRTAARIARPLADLQAAVLAVARGNFDAKLDLGSVTQDEIGVLGQAFNKMAEDLKANQDRLVHMAHHDALTQLPNRVLVYDRLEQAVARARRRGLKAGVIFLDLDRFKAINDTFGHAAGDLMLRQASERLSSCLRADDTIGRLGGDEFAVVLSDLADAQDCVTVAEKLLNALLLPVQVDQYETFISASIGVAIFPADGDSADTLLKNADAAMYRAKEKGRNNVQFYTAEMNERALEALKLETNLRHALAREEFALHLQPKVSLETGEITGFEALLRWRLSDGAFVSPASFVPLLEQTGLIVPVGEWVLRAACAQIRDWQRAQIAPVPVAINLSAKQFQRQDIFSTVKRLLTEFEIEPRLLEIEITESTAMEHAEEVVATLRDLKAIGVRIAIDDFGTGYSSLSYLTRLPVDSIKIDRSFIGHVGDNPHDSAIARAIITMAHGLRLKVIAEGVETAAQLAFLVSNGCDEVQGYYFSRPLPGAECAAMLKQQLRLQGPETSVGARRGARLVDQEDWWHGKSEEIVSIF